MRAPGSQNRVIAMLRLFALWPSVLVLFGVVCPGKALAAGLFLTEMATPDLGTAAAGRAATADNAAIAFGNPAGMTRLDSSQMLVGLQPAYGITEFDKDNDTTVSGGNGGNALGFIPSMGATSSTARRPISSSAFRWVPTSVCLPDTRGSGPGVTTP